MRRHSLTDEQWARLAPVLPLRQRGPASHRGERLFVDAVLFRAKTGLPWRDLPERFGPWKTVYNRFARWAEKGYWADIFRELQLEIDNTGSVVDGSVVRAHQDASGGKGGSSVMLLAEVVEASQPSSVRSSIPTADRSTSRSRLAKDTK